MRFSPKFLDDIRARLPVSQVVAKKVPLKRKGREFAGLSPFKDEKTPSFFVNDQKGFYHCFASGEHGDIFRFVMETEGLTFPEAVERLAGEAGIPMPAPEERTPEQERRADERTRLYELLELAAGYFEDEFKGPRGREARAYLDKRGLRRETIEAFRIGYAPADRNALKGYLAEAGFTAHEMAQSGMVVHGDDIAVPYDRFRDRVMFPICDLKGRVIAFGGRALDANVPAKYLNSPETPLFHKGAQLFNADKARQPAYERAQVIVVEGYMDVAALHEAGFPNAVAPLGTALTEDQVRLLWRMTPEPILCFDGDSAGKKAAFRAVETALPLLRAGHSLGFAFLPDGLDPDDLIRQEGPEALNLVLQRALPLAEVLWQREWGAGQWQTPERRAALEQQLFQLLEKIGDQAVRTHYQRAIRSKLFDAWRADSGRGAQGKGNGRQQSGQPYRQGGGYRQGNGGYGQGGGGTGGARKNGNYNNSFQGRGGGRFGAPPSASSSLRNSRIVSGRVAEPSSREALLICALINHPWLIEEHSEEIAELEFASKAMTTLRDAILSAQVSIISLDRSALRNHLSRSGLDRFISVAERAITHRSDKFAAPEAERAAVETGWHHAYALHIQRSRLQKALDAAKRAWDEDGSDEAFAHLLEIKRLVLHGGEECADVDFDQGRAESSEDTAVEAEPGGGLEGDVPAAPEEFPAD